MYQHEEQGIIRISGELKDLHRETTERIQQTGNGQEQVPFKEVLNADHLEKWRKKPIHGYFDRKMRENDDINMNKSYAWLQSENYSSNIEGYLFFMQEQVNTNAAKKIREKDPAKRPNSNGKCRLYAQRDEDLFHIICSCPKLSNTLYLHQKHDRIARMIYQETVNTEKGTFTEYIEKPPAVTKIGTKEIWWNTSINLPTKVEHNKPDIVIWDIDEKKCVVVEVSAPLDTNISARTSWKENVYIPLIGEMKRIYREYKFETISIVVGALGAVMKQLTTNLKRLNFKESRTKTITRKLQKASILGLNKNC